jgi:hypothetical protein
LIELFLFYGAGWSRYRANAVERCGKRGRYPVCSAQHK